MNRRDFISQSMTTLAASCAISKLNAAASAPAKKNANRIGIQLYSINKFLPEDISGCLQKLSDMGYAYAETYGYNGSQSLGKSLKEWAEMLEDAGMKLSGTHCGTSLLPPDINAAEWDYWRKSADEMKAAGGKYLIQSFIPARKTLDDVKRTAEQFNKAGAICQKAKLMFGYHNHHEEMKELEGHIVLDTLLQNTDPSLVFFQMDLGHALNGGGDILSYMKEYPGRFLSWHASDFKKGTGYVELGKGDVPYEELFNIAESYGLKDLTVEQESGEDRFAACKRNFDYLYQFQWSRKK